MTLHPHGHYRRYRKGCRCTPCRHAHAADLRRHRHATAAGTANRLVDATGTMRRIRALAVEGWSPAIVAARMGTEPSHIRTIARGERTYVTALTARSIAMIYDEWYAEPGPSKLGIAHARKQRWHGPEAWNDDTIDDPCASPIRPRRPRDPDRDVDEVAVHRALSGDHSVHLNRPERSEAVRIAALRGYPPEETARRLGVTERTVERWRAAHRREQVAAA